MSHFAELCVNAGISEQEAASSLELSVEIAAEYVAGTRVPTAREIQILRGLALARWVHAIRGTSVDSDLSPRSEGLQMNVTARNRARLDEVQQVTVEKLAAERRSELGQFMTPSSVADFMADLFQCWSSEVRLLEPSAGVGSLVDSFAHRFIAKSKPESALHITCYEIETSLGAELTKHLQAAARSTQQASHKVSTQVHIRDFVEEATFALSFGAPKYTHIILNPPYKKIAANSKYRLLLRDFGVETVNLYTTFLGLCVLLADDGAEIVAIIPRSFCNGLYFRPFREWLLERVSIEHIHVFESRKKAFSKDDVLQENIIVRLKRGKQCEKVRISSSHDQSLVDYKRRLWPFTEIVKQEDSERFIHIPIEDIALNQRLFTHSLVELGLTVSTGPVVDFRVRDYWLEWPTKECVPLLYAHHFSGGTLVWPKAHKKPNALTLAPDTQKWTLARGAYTVIKRFSSKEERKRIVAYVVNPNDLPHPYYGFENHLNVIHSNKQGLDLTLARGIAVFLNSTVVDRHFRSFSGHTQVNATDLRQMKFPNKEILLKLGQWADEHCPLTQELIDKRIEEFDG